MLNNSGANVVVDLGSTKQAALFFDHVIPFDGVEGLSGIQCVCTSSRTSVDLEKARSIILQLLPPDFGTAEQLGDFASVAAIGVTAIQVAAGFYNCEEMFQQAKEYEAKLEAPTRFSKYVTGGQVTVESGVHDADSNEAPEAQRALVSIADIVVPDTQELSWDAIVELRKDVEARQRLRRLRVFAAKEYAGKSRAFIEDDLSVRMDEYEHTLKTWGIKTTLGALSTCLTVQTALETGIADLVALLSGLTPATAFATSLAIPFGRFVLELGTIRLARQEAIRQYPLAYITDVKNGP